ncbi:MAG TPA: PspC domain-containing protein [Bacteroidales bacterium]|nr:PspC domain-containing protein [Bacteroidales bacterium]
MKKTVSINLNGLIFNIDEDAFMVLSDYLEKLKAYFSKKEEGEEIMSDIELRIAEIFTSKISPSKLVINISDVEEVMNTMGRVEEICDGDSSTDTGSRAGEKKNQKKFFRDTDNRLLGGVCAGLSHYSGINLLAIRILFVVFFLFSAGFVTLVYFILWLIVPKAVTVADRLEMKGKDINISNIENTIKEEYKEVKENFRKMKNSKNFQDNLNRSGRVMAGSLNIILVLLPF